VGIVSSARGVGGTIALTSGLDPDDGIDVRVVGVGRWADTEAGTLDVAPITPLASDVLNTRATLVNDEVSGDYRRR
jgi:hypothetical protein